MAARKKRTPVVPLNDTDFEVGDLTENTHPVGTPTADDGTIAPEGTPMSVLQAKKVGALDETSARGNKQLARVIDRKIKGETNVSWGTTDVYPMFDGIKAAGWATSTVITIKELDNEVEYPPVSMGAFRSVEDFYRHMQTAVHKNKPQCRYKITFKDRVQYSNRGMAYLTMPDATEAGASAAVQPQQAPWQLPPWSAQGGQPGGYPPPHGFGAPPYGGGSIPYQQPPQASPQQAAPTAPQPQPIFIPPGTDPATAAILAQMQRDQQSHRDRLDTLMLQMSGALGGLEEFKRREAQQQMYAAQQPPQPQYTPPPQAQGAPVAQAAPPPPSPVYPDRTAGQPQPYPPQQQQPPQQAFLGYAANGQPIWGYPPGGGLPGQPPGPWNPGVGAVPLQQAAPPPPPPPPQAATNAPPQSPAQQMAAFASTLSQMMGSLDAVKKAVGAPTGRAAQQVEEEVDDDTPPAPTPMAEMVKIVQTDPNNPEALAIAHNADGSLNWPATGMANFSKIPGLLHKFADAASRATHVVEQVQHTRPITVQGHTVPSGPPSNGPQRIGGLPPPQPQAIPRTPMIPASIPVRTS